MTEKIDLELLPEYLLAFGEKIRELDYAGYDSFLVFNGGINIVYFWIKSNKAKTLMCEYIEETSNDYASFSDFMESCFKKANKLMNK